MSKAGCAVPGRLAAAIVAARAVNQRLCDAPDAAREGGGAGGDVGAGSGGLRGRASHLPTGPAGGGHRSGATGGRARGENQEEDAL